MANNTIIPVPQPRFGIHEIVYLRESALLGYLEAVKVANVRFDPGSKKTFYIFTFKKNNPNSQIAGDAIDLKSGKIIEIIEDEIISYQEALILKQNSLEAELALTEKQLQTSMGFPSIDVIEEPSTEPLDYGDVIATTTTGGPGSFKSVTYTITNSGKSALILSNIAIYGDPDFVVYTQPSLIIDPNESSDFTIRFSPIAIGRRVGSVYIANNDPTSNPMTFTIEGNGI